MTLHSWGVIFSPSHGVLLEYMTLQHVGLVREMFTEHAPVIG